MVSFEVDGDAVPEEQTRSGRLTIEKDVYAPTLGGRSQSFTIALDPEKDPRAFDLTGRDGPNVGRVFKGIYKLSGDTLTMCRGVTAETERPVEFATGAETGHSLVVWRRPRQ